MAWISHAQLVMNDLLGHLAHSSTLMSEPSLFRHYQIVQDAEGGNVELIRSAEQVAVLAFDNERLEFVHCHVLLEPLKNRPAFEQACGALRQSGHPLLAPMIDFGEDDGNPFYITTSVDGETVRGYLQRQTEIPLWLATMLTVRSLEAAIVLSESGDYLTDQPLDSFRVVQTSTSAIQVIASDYRLLENPARSKSRLIKANFERQAKFLRTFLHEQGGGPTLPDAMLPTVDFAELLGSTLSSGGPGLTGPMSDLRNALKKMVPEHLAGEIPTAQKPRALIAPLLATYQEVARGVVNLVRIQSQRLDMANPYSMRGTLTRTGRSVLVEQVPPPRLCGKKVDEIDRLVQKVSKKREFTALVQMPLLNESEGLTCLAEDVVEGIPLADILRERSGLTVAEAYVVMASLDAALSQLERANVPIRKLRLEDIFLLTGFGREDPRTARLLASKLNEWPSFNIMLRVHPTVASMAGRGTNPGTLLPPPLKSAGIWHGGWMAALGKFLLGLDTLVSDAPRDRETLVRLFDDEIVKSREGTPNNRSDLLARFARIIQHYDLVGTSAAPPIEPPIKPRTSGSRKKGEDPVAAPAPAPVSASTTAPATSPAPAAAKPSVMPLAGLPMDVQPMSPIAMGSILAADGAADNSDESIGFAELLFQRPAATGAKSGSAWGKGASESFDQGQVGNWQLDQPDSGPWWLKATVFIAGSMMAGALLAHFSGHAIWQKLPHQPPSPPAATSKAGHP